METQQIHEHDTVQEHDMLEEHDAEHPREEPRRTKRRTIAELQLLEHRNLNKIQQKILQVKLDKIALKKQNSELKKLNLEFKKRTRIKRFRAKGEDFQIQPRISK